MTHTSKLAHSAWESVACGIREAALVEALCKRLRDHYDLYVITNDIYTKKGRPTDPPRAEALPADASEVETGCPTPRSRRRFDEPRAIE
jgi:Ni2+-binding GTPase involved in maturation of urease and hydrogenase